jgi:hypothetical protein
MQEVFLSYSRTSWTETVRGLGPVRAANIGNAMAGPKADAMARRKMRFILKHMPKERRKDTKYKLSSCQEEYLRCQ